jgi:sulfide:quinone oxidoreductase
MDNETQQTSPRQRVLIAGGGVAAVEAMLALRELAGDRVAVELHAPRRDFVYRPLAVGEPFVAGGLVEFDLEDLTGRAGATFHPDSIVRVEPESHRAATSDGHEVDYDHLLIATGARSLAPISGAQTFWGVSDEDRVVETMRRLRAGEIHRLAFTVPATGWPLPIYELALLAGAELQKLGIRDGAKLTIVTSEEAPLGVFGVDVGRQVGDLLAQRGIDLVTGTHAVNVSDGLLHVSPGYPIEVDEVISTPDIEGRHVGGIATDSDGFVAVDEFSRVIGMKDVYAAGDVTTFPVKRSDRRRPRRRPRAPPFRPGPARHPLDRREAAVPLRQAGRRLRRNVGLQRSRRLGARGQDRRPLPGAVPELTPRRAAPRLRDRTAGTCRRRLNGRETAAPTSPPGATSTGT